VALTLLGPVLTGARSISLGNPSRARLHFVPASVRIGKNLIPDFVAARKRWTWDTMWTNRKELGYYSPTLTPTTTPCAFLLWWVLIFTGLLGISTWGPTTSLLTPKAEDRKDSKKHPPINQMLIKLKTANPIDSPKEIPRILFFRSFGSFYENQTQ